MQTGSLLLRIFVLREREGVSVERNMDSTIKAVTGNTMDTSEEMSPFQAGSIDQLTLDEVCARNIEKLRRRFPEGFSEGKSINRAE